MRITGNSGKLQVIPGVILRVILRKVTGNSGKLRVILKVTGNSGGNSCNPGKLRMILENYR